MKNIVLIGMPGVGKSTVGVVLAKKLGYCFVDSDIVIQETEKKLLHEIITEKGIDGFLRLENRINASLAFEKAVIATGGSAVYGREAMQHLKGIGTVVYLRLSYTAIEERLGDLNERGVTMRRDQSLRDLYDERIPLYEKYADIIINCEKIPIREIISLIINKLQKEKALEYGNA